MILRLSADARWWKLLLLALVVVCFVCWYHPDDPLVVGSSADYDQKVEDLVAAEEWIELMGGVMNSRVTLIQSIPGDRQFGVVTFMNEFVGAGLIIFTEFLHFPLTEATSAELGSISEFVIFLIRSGSPLS